jgi:hypothetical protein
LTIFYSVLQALFVSLVRPDVLEVVWLLHLIKGGLLRVHLLRVFAVQVGFGKRHRVDECG